MEHFLEEKESIETYLEHIEISNKRGSAFFFEKTFKPFLSQSLGWFIRKYYTRYSQKTTLEVLNEFTQNKRLIAVLYAQCGNYTVNYDSICGILFHLNRRFCGGLCNQVNCVL